MQFIGAEPGDFMQRRQFGHRIVDDPPLVVTCNPAPGSAEARGALRCSRLGRLGLLAVLVVLVLLGAGCGDVRGDAAASPTRSATTQDAQAKADQAAQAQARAEAHAKRRAEAQARAQAEAKQAAEQRRQERRERQAQERAVRTPGTAAHLLAGLAVRGRAPMTGYDRDQFGQAWLDADRNGCDTRNDILRRDLRGTRLKPGTGDCVVLEGTLPDPYTAQRIWFVRAETYSVDIDHVVALGNAWVSGAWRHDMRTRAALANDPLNLLAADASANRSKGDGDAATWLPPNRRFRCSYVARQVAVKAKYRLSVTRAERDAMARVLASCPGQPVTPDTPAAPTRVDHNIGPPDHSGDRSGGGASQPGRKPLSGSDSVYYENCDAARAVGAAPVHRGDPGYGDHLDRDGDGSACE